MRRAGLIGVAFITTLGLAACDSSDDDGVSGMGTDTGSDTGAGTGTGGMTSGDFAAIVALGGGDEPLALDATTLGSDLGTLFGDGTAEPVGIEDGDIAQTLAERRRNLATLQ